MCVCVYVCVCVCVCVGVCVCVCQIDNDTENTEWVRRKLRAHLGINCASIDYIYINCCTI